MAENTEKPCFTFFACLPPYFGVSGSLVSRTRKISMRSIDWYQQFLISWLVAWYSAVFVFYMDDYILTGGGRGEPELRCESKPIVFERSP